MKKIFLLFILAGVNLYSYAQPNVNLVGQLISAENYFSSLVIEKGISEAFKMVSDNNTIIFRPGPVSALSFYKDRKNTSGQLSWHPVYARISKSGDWGFTTGPYINNKDSSSAKEYGDYVSVWKKNKKDVWRLAVDLGVSHPKPKTEVALHFPDPSSTKFRKQYGPARLKQREDIVFTTDQLFALQLKKAPYLAYNEFLYDDATFYFPGIQPIDGKENIINYLRKNAISIETDPSVVDRAFSGDMAYTYGKATVITGTSSKPFHYLRIWEVGDGYKWNVLLEIFTPDVEQSTAKL